MGRKRNLIISLCIKLSRNFEILDFLREQILSKNLGESPRTGNTFYQLSEDIRTSLFSTSPSCALFFWGANISSAKCYFFVPGYITLCFPCLTSYAYVRVIYLERGGMRSIHLVPPQGLRVKNCSFSDFQ